MGTDFFVSYNQVDLDWAEWIAWHIEDAGYRAVLQAWDFRPGMNFVVEMQRASEKASRIIAVLSPEYLSAPFPQSEWAAAFGSDPTGSTGKLLPVRVRECHIVGLLSSVIHIDLVGLEESTARKTLLNGLRFERVKPQAPPQFPLHERTDPDGRTRPPVYPGDILITASAGGVSVEARISPSDALIDSEDLNSIAKLIEADLELCLRDYMRRRKRAGHFAKTTHTFTETSHCNISEKG